MDNKIINPQKYSLDYKGKFLFMRHGQTLCNSDKNYKERKFNYNYIDSHLSEKGIRQTKKLKEKLDKLNIEAIYVSPLFRSLETAKYMIENLNYQGEIIVHPLIIECLNCIDDIIFDIKETKHYFRNLNINWNIFDEYIQNYQKWNENFYYFEYFNRLNEEQKKIKYKKLLELYEKRQMMEYQKEVVKEIPSVIFNVESEIKPFESFKHVYSRFLDFINFLKIKHKESMNDLDKKIIVITHGDFLGVITNKYLYENDDINYFPNDCCYSKNCDIISIYV